MLLLTSILLICVAFFGYQIGLYRNTQEVSRDKVELEKLLEDRIQGMEFWHFEETLINQRVSWLAIFQSLLFSGWVLSHQAIPDLMPYIAGFGLATCIVGVLGVGSGIRAQIGWDRRYKLNRRSEAPYATFFGWAAPSTLIASLIIGWAYLFFYVPEITG